MPIQTSSTCLTRRTQSWTRLPPSSATERLLARSSPCLKKNSMRQRSSSQWEESLTSRPSSRSLSGDVQVTSPTAKMKAQIPSPSCQLSMVRTPSWEATTRETKEMMMRPVTRAAETTSIWWWTWSRTRPSQIWTMRVPRIEEMTQWLSCLGVMISATANPAQDRVVQAQCLSVTGEAQEAKLRTSIGLREKVRSTWLRLTTLPSHTTRPSFAPTERSSSSTSRWRSAMKSACALKESRKHPSNWTRWWRNSCQPSDQTPNPLHYTWITTTLFCGVHNLDQP